MFSFYDLFNVGVDENWWDFEVVFLVVFFWDVFFFVYFYVSIISICKIFVNVVNLFIFSLDVVNGFFFNELKVVKVDVVFEENLFFR